MPKLVVKKHEPFVIILVVGLLSAMVSVVIWLLLDENHWQATRNQLIQKEDYRLLRDVNQRLNIDNAQLREEVIILERLTEIDTQAAARLQDDLKTLQDQIYHINGELEFYESIMTATTDSKGLNIQGLHIVDTGQENFYNFKLILTNVANSDKIVEVTMTMTIEGMSETGPQILSLDKMTADNQYTREIKFKNFERIEGNLTLPEGFKPLRVVVDLRQKNMKRSAVIRVFEWSTKIG
ncbi:MAG: hypothetical protein CMF45_00505 [Legionellales bacterium]|nr:hypothetical protein [Legionellales bacterium]